MKSGVPEDGSKVAVAPSGRPEAPKVTVPVKPAIALMEMVMLMDSPCLTEPPLTIAPVSGSRASISKSGTGAAVTVSS